MSDLSSTRYLSYHEFISQNFRRLSPSLQAHYGGFERYARQYIAANGFSDWLAHCRGATLSPAQADDLGTTLALHARRQPYELPQLLNAVVRQYSLTLPEPDRRTQPAHWAALAHQNDWQTRYFCDPTPTRPTGALS